MLGTCLDNLRRSAPLIHCITNYVTANDVANVLLACGASPIMADAPEEAEEITAHTDGLCLNLGTPNPRRIEAMLAAGREAARQQHVILLDPVGVGASVFRQNAAQALMAAFPLTLVRGNVSELKTLARGRGGSHGVDAAAGDAVTPENLDAAVAFAKEFAGAHGVIAVLTGAVDLVSDGSHCYVIRNGRPEMGRITGTGCQLSGMLTAFAAANPAEPLEAAAAAVCAMGLAGELAWERLQPGDGNVTYRNRIIDAIYHMDGKTLEQGASYELR